VTITPAALLSFLSHQYLNYFCRVFEIDLLEETWKTMESPPCDFFLENGTEGQKFFAEEPCIGEVCITMRDREEKERGVRDGRPPC